MAETILSVGIDVGTSTTQVLFSRLTIDNIAGAGVVPRIQIIDKNVIFRGEIRDTPLLAPDLIDAEALKRIVVTDFERAGFTPGDVSTGAAIITGETARAENAEQVLATLSEMAGDFVVATAGPALESVLAARGTGIDAFSDTVTGTVANLDIGGGTTNIAAYRGGRLLGVSCLDIGGRLVRIRDGRIGYISAPMRRLAEASGISVAVGDPVDIERFRALTRVMARHLAMALHLTSQDEIHASLYTNDGTPLAATAAPAIVSFSGGVADLIDAPRDTDPLRYGDIGVLLGQAIADETAFALVERHRGLETIGATVVGAGVHTTEISGATIEYAAGLLPVRNVPTIRIPGDREEELAAEIGRRLKIIHPDTPDQTVAICFEGRSMRTFGDVQRVADAIISGARAVLDGPNLLVVVLENDRAKALGQTIAVKRGRRDDVICIDGVHTSDGDYIDIGTPVASGRAVPVVVKTLVFND